MDLSSFLQGPGARVKEAEALAILAANALPARRMLDAAKREFGEVLPISDFGVFISPIAEQNYKQGKKEATRLLFDGYAEIIFPHLPDAKTFIASLDEIAARVNTALSVIDRDEAFLCRLAWEKMAWERAQPTWLGSAWRNLKAHFKRSTPCRKTERVPAEEPERPGTVNQVLLAGEVAIESPAESEATRVPQTGRAPAESAPRGIVRPGGSQSDPAAPGGGSSSAENGGSSFDFSSDDGRSKAVAAYTQHWTCSEAGLARTANVDPADLSKWKKGSLPADSDKKKRIETALRNNEQPTPAARKPADS
jgi:hypothetical protein